MNHYLVTWDIDLWADTPEAAAEQARAIQRDPTSTATVFSVRDVDADVTTELQVDLDGTAVRG